MARVCSVFSATASVMEASTCWTWICRSLFPSARIRRSLCSKRPACDWCAWGICCHVSPATSLWCGHLFQCCSRQLSPWSQARGQQGTAAVHHRAVARLCAGVPCNVSFSSRCEFAQLLSVTRAHAVLFCFWCTAPDDTSRTVIVFGAWRSTAHVLGHCSRARATGLLLSLSECSFLPLIISVGCGKFW